MLTFQIILLQFFFQSSEEQRLVNTKMEIVNRESFRLSLKIGKGEKALNKAINQDNDFTWIYVQEFNESSYPSSNKILTFDSGSIYEDTLTFFNNNQTIIPQFPYYVIDNKSAMELLHLGDIGFGFKFENENNSIVHQLYKNNYIDHLSYSFIPGNNSDNYIYFGGIFSEIKKKMNNGICYVTPNLTKWECIIKKITIGSFNYNVATPVYFQSSEEPLYAPQVFMSKLMNQVFDRMINDSICSIILLLKRETIKCLTNIIEAMPMINFTIYSYIYSFELIEFFENDGKYSYLNIMANPYENDTWIFGISFLKHFNSLFDYENEYVQLFSNTRIARVEIGRMMICYVNCGITIVGIVFLIIWRIDFNKEFKG